MKTPRIFGSAACILLSACSVLLPQSAATDDVGETARNPGVEIVEEAVEVLPPGAAAYEGEIGPTTVEIVGGDEAALQEFVEHWLGSTYSGQPADQITVYIGNLPPDLPYDLPIPENARVIGSVRQSQYLTIQVILETTRSPEEILAFYEERLPELGWQAVTSEIYGGGFVSGELGTTYCHGEDTSLNIQAGVWPSGSTDVRIYTFSNYDYSPCHSDRQYGYDSISSLIPTLKSPPGAQMGSIGGGGSSGTTDAYNETQLTTDLTAGEVAAYYNAQLLDSGWTLLENGESEGHAWSSWSFTDEGGQAWSGTLILLEVPPGSDTLFAYIQISR